MDTEISINTPALLFPAITLLMLAYTNRFLALASLIRNLHSKYKQVREERTIIREQIRNLKRRLLLVKQMQGSGIISFFLCVLCMLCELSVQGVRAGCYRDEALHVAAAR